MRSKATILLSALILTTFALSSSNAIAARSGIDLTVELVRIGADGKGYIEFTSLSGGSPTACAHSAHTRKLGFDVATDGGMAIYKMALAVQLSGKLLTVSGTGACTAFSNIEDVNWLKLAD